MRHEQNAAFAVSEYARVAERLGVVSTVSGRGATNLITGVADALFDSVPVLFLTDQVTTTTYKFDHPVRQFGYQETDIVSIASRNPLATFESNVKGTWNILEACRRDPLIKRIVAASGDKAYGSQVKLPFDENTSLEEGLKRTIEWYKGFFEDNRHSKPK